MRKHKKVLVLVLAVISALLSYVFVVMPRGSTLVSRYPTDTLEFCPQGQDCDMKRYEYRRGFPFIWNEFELTQAAEDPNFPLDSPYFDSIERTNYVKKVFDAILPLAFGAALVTYVLRRVR